MKARELLVVFSLLATGWGRIHDIEVREESGNAVGSIIATPITHLDYGDVSFVFKGFFDADENLSGQAVVNVTIDSADNADNTDVKYHYHGQWKNGVAERNGTEISPLAQYGHPNETLYYIGQFHNGLKHGYGVAMYSWCDDDEKESNSCKQYQGEWVKGKRHGPAKWMGCNGGLYSGSFKNDQINYKDIVSWPYGFASENLIDAGEFVPTYGNLDNGDISFVFKGSFDKNDKLLGNATVNVSIDTTNIKNFQYSYNGQWKDGVAEGHGTEVSPLEEYPLESMHYVGQFHNGNRHGLGEANYSWCDVKLFGCKEYKGGWANGQHHGQALWTGCNGDSYNGSFKNGKRNGPGRFQWSHGSFYEVLWKDDHRETGIYINENIASYKYKESFGQDKDHFGDDRTATGSDIKHIDKFNNSRGAAKHNYPKISDLKIEHASIYYRKYSYDGMWRNGIAEGNGTEISPLEQFGYPYQTFEYVGQYLNGTQHGYGHAKYSWCGVESPKYTRDGKEYSPEKFSEEEPSWTKEYKGYWKNGKRHGHGEWIGCNGDRYNGSYENDERHGNGIYNWTNGDSYDGPWKDGMKDGKKGRFDWNDTEFYEGSFKNDMRHGKGNYTTKTTQTEFVGKWSYNIPYGIHSYTLLDGKKGQVDVDKGCWWFFYKHSSKETRCNKLDVYKYQQ